MAKSGNIKQFAGQRLKELFPRATSWQEQSDFPVGSQTVDLMVRFKMGTAEPTLIVESSSVGQPRQIRETSPGFADVRRELPVPIPSSSRHVPQRAHLLKRSGGLSNLSGNCYCRSIRMIETDEKPNLRARRGPLRSLFAPRPHRPRGSSRDPQLLSARNGQERRRRLGHGTTGEAAGGLSWVDRESIIGSD